ncbi:MAG: hypothetical protein RL136_1691 [Planctomycetota bacterium]|jgi:hypothetical protein
MRDPNESVVVARFPDELSALLLVSDLESQGIKATVVGGLTAQLRVEAPGLVSVLVRARDLEAALQVIADNAPPEGWEDEAEQTPADDADL